MDLMYKEKENEQILEWYNGLHLKISSGIQKLYININLYLYISIKYNNS